MSIHIVQDWLVRLGGKTLDDMPRLKDINDKDIYYPHYVYSDDIDDIIFNSSGIARAMFMTDEVQFSKDTLKYIYLMEQRSLEDMESRLAAQYKNSKKKKKAYVRYSPGGTTEGFRTKFQLRIASIDSKELVRKMQTEFDYFQQQFAEFKEKWIKAVQ